MADVNVNIRGRDDGLGSQLDALREKAISLGRDVENLNRATDMSPTKQRLTVEKESKETLKLQQDRIRSEYQEIRTANIQEFQQSEQRYARGEISKGEFEEQRNLFQSSQKDLNEQEEKELATVEKEMVLQMRLILRELIDKRKLDREQAQRDKKEFEDKSSSGLYGSLVEENKELKKQRLMASSPEEVSEIDAKIRANQEAMKGLGGKPSDDREIFDSQQITSLANAMASANLASTSMQLAKAGGGLISAKGGMMAAGTVGALYGLLSQGDQIIEAGAGLGALRGRGYTGQASSLIAQRESTEGLGGVASGIGMSASELLNEATKKAKESGVVGTNIVDRAMDDISFKRAFGADASIFSKFERFSENQIEATEISLDVLNVLTSIKESSLKEGDLVTLGEKMQSQATIMGIQRSKRDVVDTESSLRILAALESVGLSQKGEMSSDFISKTLQGLGEGGSDNLMLLKYEAARRAKPEIANDPAALRRFIKFSSDDPEYIKQFFGFANELTQGNQMAMDDLLYSFFNPQSEYDMQMYEKMMSGAEGGDFGQLLLGKGLDKTRKSTLTKEFAYQESQGMAGGLSQAVAGFKAEIGNLGARMEEFFSKVSGEGGGINVNVLSSKVGTLPVSSKTKNMSK
jgi:hypothetical protein